MKQHFCVFRALGRLLFSVYSADLLFLHRTTEFASLINLLAVMKRKISRLYLLPFVALLFSPSLWGQVVAQKPLANSLPVALEMPNLVWESATLPQSAYRWLDHNRYRTAIFHAPGQKVMPHTLSLLFQLPSYGTIEYTPEIKPMRWLLAPSTPEAVAIDSLKMQLAKPTGIRETMVWHPIFHPLHTNYTWAEIPDPTKNIKEGKLLDKKVEDNLFRMIWWDDSGSRNLIKKPKEVVSPWSYSGTEHLQLSQAYLSNWVKGGESSVNLLSDLRFKALYKQGKHEWESSGIHKIGILASGKSKSRLSDDLIELSSKYGLKAASNWYYSFLTNFRTQFFYGYDKDDTERKNPLSGFLSPAYMQFIPGMDYKKENLSILLSPFTSIVTVVTDTARIDQTRFKIADHKKSSIINGLSVTANWKYKITREITYQTRMELFYEYLGRDGQKRFDWESILDLRVNRYLTTRILLQLRYFDNESKKFQVRENFNIAFKYGF